MFRKILISIVICFFAIAPASASFKGIIPTLLEPVNTVVSAASSVVNAGVCAVTSILFGDCSSGSQSALNGLNGTTLDGGGAADGLQVFESNYRGNTYDSAIGMITGWTNFALPFVSVIAIAALVYAGFLYLTSFGNDEQSGKAKKIILWVVIGIVLIISAYAIVNTLIETDDSASFAGGDDFSLNVDVGGVEVDIK